MKNNFLIFGFLSTVKWPSAARSCFHGAQEWPKNDERPKEKSETAPHTTPNKKPDLYHIHHPGNRGPEVAKHGQKIRKVQKKLKSPEVELRTIGGAPCKKSTFFLSIFWIP